MTTVKQGKVLSEVAGFLLDEYNKSNNRKIRSKFDVKFCEKYWTWLWIPHTHKDGDVELIKIFLWYIKNA